MIFTLRQRIVGRRGISRQMAAAGDSKKVKELIKAYQYPGKDTCVADSLCSTRCPVGIDTGKMVKALRQEANGRLGNTVADRVVGNLSEVAKTISTTLHVVESVHKMTGTPLMEKASSLARACAKEVVMPAEIYCCGFAGDRGFNFPELNAAALKDLKAHVCICEAGYSTSKTGEIGLSLHGGIPYRSIL